MSSVPNPDITVDVNLRNPGQFFACCGLFELASRLWPGSEANGWREPAAWFDLQQSTFSIAATGSERGMAELLEQLSGCTLTGLSEAEVKERNDLDAQQRASRRGGPKLLTSLDLRRKELGDLARKGPVRIGAPFGMLLNWWQDEEASPKTWAGLQEIHKVARAAQDVIRPEANSPLFDHYAVLRLPAEYRRGRSSVQAVEAFYFDARRFSDALAVGYSHDVLGAETVSFPAVELLCLIGLQRFRSAPVRGVGFTYRAWSVELPCSVAAAVACRAVIVPGQSFEFGFRFRDEERRYKAFDYARPLMETGDDK